MSLEEAAPTALPEPTLRLFDGYAAEDLARPASRAFVIERLLEEGDRQDLRWMSESFGEAQIRSVFKASRGLSARSRRFWSLVLDGQLDVEPPSHEDIWPL